MTVYPNYQLPCGKVLPALPSRVASVYAWLERWHRQNGRLVFCTGYLAGKMEVSERTAYSWLEKMRSAGYIHCDRVGRERHITPLARPFFLRGRASGVRHECFSDSAPIPPIVFTQDAYTHNAQQTDTTDTTASEASPVVVSKQEERETAPGSPKNAPMPKLPVLGEGTSKSATLAPLIIPKVPGSAYDHLNGGTADALIAEVAVLASIPATDAARAVSLNPAQARNAAQAAHEVKEKREPIRLFWALYWRKAMPNPPPDPKPSRIATEGAKTVHHRPVVESVGGLTGWAAIEALRGKMKTAGRTERARA